MLPFYIFLGVAVSLSLIGMWLSIIRVSEGTVKLVERFGKYHRTLHSGINFIVPGLDNIKRGMTLFTLIRGGEEQKSLVGSDGAISISEEILDPAKFHTIAKDNAMVEPDLLCYFKLLEPYKAVYRVGNFCDAMMQLLETTLRQEFGKMDSDALIVSRDTVGAVVQRHLERASEAWGAKILRVEIQEIRFSADVRQHLTKAREAELERRAKVITAQQHRDADVLLAEGKKRASILIAEGEFEAAKLRAEGDFLLSSRRLQGEAEGTRALAEALRDNPEVMIAFKALEAQKSVAESLGKSSNSLIIPSEMAGLTGAIGAVRAVFAFMSERNGVSHGGAHVPAAKSQAQATNGAQVIVRNGIGHTDPADLPLKT